MPSLFRKKSTKPVAQPDPALQSKASLYDELVAYLQKASSQLASCTDASSADQASHEWRYLAGTPPPPAPTTTTADESSDKQDDPTQAPMASPVADLAKILADALTTRSELVGLKDRLAKAVGELQVARQVLAATQADLAASKSATAADVEAIKVAARAEVDAATQSREAETEHLRTSLNAAWQLVEDKSHALAKVQQELARVTGEARELKQRVEFLEAVDQAAALASAATGDVPPSPSSRFKIVVREDSGVTDEDTVEGGKRGLVAADSTATMVEEEEEEEDEQEEGDTRSMGVQTPTPAKMWSKLGTITKFGAGVVVPRIVVKNVFDEIIVGADGSDEDGEAEEIEVSRLVPLL